MTENTSPPRPGENDRHADSDSGGAEACLPAEAPPGPARRTNWPIAIGTISIILGCVSILAMLSYAFVRAGFLYTETPERRLIEYLTYAIYLTMVLAGVLLVVRRPSGWTLLMLVAVALAVRMMFTFGSSIFRTFLPATADVTDMAELFSMGYLQSVLWLRMIGYVAFPVFLLVWLCLPAIRSEVSGWKRRSGEADVGDEPPSVTEAESLACRICGSYDAVRSAHAGSSSVWPIPIGILSAVLASITVLLGLIVMVAAIRNLAGDAIAGGIVALLLGLVLLGASVRLLRRLPDARGLHLFVGCAQLVAVCGLVILSLYRPWHGLTRVPASVKAMLLLLGGGYPVFLIAWFSRSVIVQEMSAWPRPETPEMQNVYPLPSRAGQARGEEHPPGGSPPPRKPSTPKHLG